MAEDNMHKDWQHWSAEALAAERKRREAGGRRAAENAPEPASETRITIAGVSALKCIPKQCRSPVPHLFIHGGGWVFGSSIQSLGLIRRLAWQTARPVISLDYALAPEHPYPKAIEDVSAVLAELAIEGGLAGLIAGSAGAQIALHAMARSGGAQPAGAILFCGAFLNTTDSWAHRAFGNGTGTLSSVAMRQYHNAYAMPANAPAPDLTHLPPLFLSVGDSDPLLDDTLQLHAAASVANGSRLEVVPGADHGFMNGWHETLRIDRAVTDALSWLERICIDHSGDE